MWLTNFRKRLLASDRVYKQIFGAVLQNWFPLLLIIFMLTLLILPTLSVAFQNSFISDHRFNKLLQLMTLGMFGVMVFVCCRTLNRIFSLHKNELGITISQITILVVIGVLIIGFIVITNIKEHTEYALALTLVGAVMSWIFQDTIKGVAAFLHLRLNGLISIGDWIKVPHTNVDGQVKRVTLTTVTVYNWDTTTSSIPTSELYTNHFINLQNMMTGKTYGRRFEKTFVFDISWIHTINDDERRKLIENEEITKYIPADEIEAGTLNISVFRQYIFHWLMNHPHISQLPRLLVRWLEPVESGLPLEVYAFIIDSTVVAYERQQSQIIEHILTAVEWFGLRLYQSPSSYDVSNSNVYLTDKAATYRNETVL